MTQRRLDDYVRVTLAENGTFIIGTRAEAKRGVSFGSAQTVMLDSEETEELYQFLDEQIGDK